MVSPIGAVILFGASMLANPFNILWYYNIMNFKDTKNTIMEVETLERASTLFAALGHPTRLRIAELLCSGPKSVNEVAASLELAQSGVSQHLAILARAGVVKVEPHRSSRIYSVRGPRIGKILALIAEFCSVHNLKGAADIEEDDGERMEPKNKVSQ